MSYHFDIQPCIYMTVFPYNVSMNPAHSQKKTLFQHLQTLILTFIIQSV